MGRRERRFVKPKYEINLESQNKVYLREEDKGPLRVFLNLFFKAVILPVAAFILATVAFQIVQQAFSPPELLISVQHITSGKSLSPTELAKINVYLDDSRKPLPKKVRHNGLTVKFKKKGVHILGIENTASLVDSALFHREKSFIKNIHLTKSLRKGKVRGDEIDFSFHKIITDREFIKTKILFYNVMAPESPKPHLVFSAYAKAPQLLLSYPTARNGGDERQLGDFVGRTMEELAGLTRHVNILTPEKLQTLREDYVFEAPTFNAFSWYSDRLKNQRYAFAEAIKDATRCTVFLLPATFSEKNDVFADFVLSFASLGGVEFEPILVRNCNADANDDKFLYITDQASLVDIIEKYLFIYQDFIETGIVHDVAVQRFADFCSALAPQVDALAYFDSRVVRNANVRVVEPSTVNLEAFLSEIEPLTCMELYKRLMTFWSGDANRLGEATLNIRDKEILRAIIRRSLALKAQRHQCSEQNWPTTDQQLSLFNMMQEVIGNRWTWEWLADEPWLDMVSGEIDSLTNK